jgi:low temperature requirement protein LtrA
LSFSGPFGDSVMNRPGAAGAACDTASDGGSRGSNCSMTDTESETTDIKSGLVGAAHRRRPLLRAMGRRDTEESHRAATPLELLFDLCFVVAVSQTGTQLNDALSVGHYQSGIVGFFMVFFAIWWAWVNFTWFASAYDVDDLLYRLLTFVQIIGVLILAAGVSNAFDHANFTVITIGYVVMRVAMVGQWLRAAAGDPAGRSVALHYAVGISICQVGWVLRLFLPHDAGVVAFYLLAVLEMLVPAWAERRGDRTGTPWHPGHINERYGLFTLIVLGECIAAATVAIHDASAVHDESSAALGAVVGGAVLLVFSIWWWYFEHPSEEGLRMSRGTAFFWGYGHYFVFSSVAALGTGLELAAASTHGGEGTVPQSEAGLAIAIPVAVFFVVTAVLQAKLDGTERWRMVLVVVTAVVVLGLGGAAAGSTDIGVATLLMGLAVATLVAIDEWRHPKRTRTEGLPA